MKNTDLDYTQKLPTLFCWYEIGNCFQKWKLFQTSNSSAKVPYLSKKSELKVFCFGFSFKKDVWMLSETLLSRPLSDD